MRSGILGAFATLFLGAGWAQAQTPAPIPSGVGPVGAAPLIAPEAFSGAGGGPILYGNAEYMLWKVRDGNLPPTATAIPIGLIAVDVTNLVTNNPANPGVPFGTQLTGFAPVSIQSSATFGSGLRTDTGSQNGVRAGLGFWLDSDQFFGLEASGFYLEKGTSAFSAASAQTPGQLIFDTGFTRTLFLNTAGTLSTLSTFNVLVTRQTTSSLTGVASTQLYGGEVNARSTFLRIGGTDLGLLAGFRYLRFEDELSLTNNVRLNQPVGIPATSTDATASLSRDLTFTSRDNTHVRNNFYGAQVGGDIDSKFGPFFAYARGKVALGTMHQVADIDSRTTIVNNDAARQSPPSMATNGGLLGGPNDNGRHTRDAFSVIPEVEVRLGYQVTDWLRGYVGYNGLFLGNTQRAGDSSSISTLNTNVTIANSNNSVNVAQPTFRFNDHDVYIQGVTFGLEAKY